MSTEVTVEQMDIEMALFEGAKYYPPSRSLFVKYSDAYEIERNGVKIGFGPDQLEYHSSWDWIHVIWKKLWYDCAIVPMEHERKWDEIRGNRCVRAILYGTIAEAHKEIYEAIQWYRSVKE